MYVDELYCITNYIVFFSVKRRDTVLKYADIKFQNAKNIDWFVLLFKVVKMLIIVVSLFAICWLPLQVYNFISAVYPAVNK